MQKTGTPDAEAMQQYGVKVQGFISRMEGVFYKHPLWKDRKDQVHEQAVEGLEKYVMSKIWSKTFAMTSEDKDKDERYHRLCDALNFLDLNTLAGLNGENALGSALLATIDGFLEDAQDHVVKMDRYKAPRDKLLCLINVKTLIEQAITDVNKKSSDISGSFGGADVFFPMLVLTIIRSKPTTLCSNIEYIRRFRGPRVTGQLDFILCNLESVAMYLDTVDWKDLNVSEDEFLARLAKAGIPEAEIQLSAAGKSPQLVLPEKEQYHEHDMTEKDGGEDVSLDGPLSPIPDKSLKDAQCLRDEQQMHPRLSSSNRDVFNSVKSLIEEGTPLVLHEESEGLLQQKYPWIYANAEDLRVVRIHIYTHLLIVIDSFSGFHPMQGEVTQLLSDYRDLVLKHEALRLALEEHLPIQADPCSRGHSSDRVDTPVSSSSSAARMAVTDAAGSLMQKLSLYSWKRDPPAPGQSTLLHSLFGRPSPSSDRPPGLSPVIPGDPTPHTTPSVHQSFLSERPSNNDIVDREEPVRGHENDTHQGENETALTLTSSDTRHQQAPTESLI